MLAAIKALWEAVNQESSLVVALAIAIVVLMYSHVHIWLASRARLRDKDRYIEDLIQERNWLQTLLLRMLGHETRTDDQEYP